MHSPRACAARPSSCSSPLQPGSTAGHARACSPPSLAAAQAGLPAQAAASPLPAFVRLVSLTSGGQGSSPTSRRPRPGQRRRRPSLSEARLLRVARTPRSSPGDI
jgi:hypothetical protein